MGIAIGGICPDREPLVSQGEESRAVIPDENASARFAALSAALCGRLSRRLRYRRRGKGWIKTRRYYREGRSWFVDCGGSHRAVPKSQTQTIDRTRVRSRVGFDGLALDSQNCDKERLQKLRQKPCVTGPSV
jgi:hypothetical protein